MSEPFEFILAVFFIVAPLFWWRAAWVLASAYRVAKTLDGAKVGLLRSNLLGALSGAIAATLIAVIGLLRVAGAEGLSDIAPLLLAAALLLFTAPAIAFEVLFRTGKLVD